MVLPRTDPKDAKAMLKAESAEVFKRILDRVRGDKEYQSLASRHRQLYESAEIPQDTSQFEENVDVK